MLVLNILEEGRFGGPQRRVMEVAKELKGFGVTTIIVVPKENSTAYQRKLDQVNLSFLVISINRLTNKPIGAIKYLLSFVSEILELKKIIVENRPCIVHANGSYQIKGVIAAKFAGVSSVWHLNDTYSPLPVRWLFALVKRFVKTSFISAAFRTRQYYLGRDPKAKQGIVVNEPVDCEHFTPDERIAIDNKEVIRVIQVGNLSPVKGIEVFLDMAAHVNRSSKVKIEFVVVGKILDSQRSYFDMLNKKRKELQLNNVEFLGEKEDIKSELQMADIYVCSSHFESSPMSIWEAMSMGLPILSTDVGDVRQILNDGNCGLVANTKDATQLAEHLLHYLRNSDEVNQHSENSRKVALESFDIGICAQAHFDLYSATWEHVKE